jgi:LysR family transcriptional regulator, cyn operon transcriptional activator
MRPVHDMDLRQLRAFVAIVDTGGFARAAGRVNLSQPALSRQIHALEADLGIRLFDRIGRRVQLTPEGEDLLRHSRRLLTEADSLGERARALRGGRAGLLRVGATPQAIETVLAGFLPRYRRRHPGVEIHLVEDGGARLPERLERGEVNLAMIPAGDARFHGRPLAPLYVLAVVPRAHRLGRRAALEIAELAEEPLLLTRREFGSRQWFEAACEVAHVRPRVLLESGAPDTLVALARAGYGTAIVPSNTRLPRSGVRAVPLVHRGITIGVWATIAWDPRHFHAPYAARFVEELVAYSRHAFPGRSLSRRILPPPRPKPLGTGLSP